MTVNYENFAELFPQLVEGAILSVNIYHNPDDFARKRHLPDLSKFNTQLEPESIFEQFRDLHPYMRGMDSSQFIVPVKSKAVKDLEEGEKFTGVLQKLLKNIHGVVKQLFAFDNISDDYIDWKNVFAQVEKYQLVTFSLIGPGPDRDDDSDLPCMLLAEYNLGERLDDDFYADLAGTYKEVASEAYSIEELRSVLKEQFMPFLDNIGWDLKVLSTRQQAFETEADLLNEELVAQNSTKLAQLQWLCYVLKTVLSAPISTVLANFYANVV